MSIDIYKDDIRVYFVEKTRDLKVAIPIDIWREIGKRLINPSQGGEVFEFGDKLNESYIRIDSYYEENWDDSVSLKSEISIAKMTGNDFLIDKLIKVSPDHDF